MKAELQEHSFRLIPENEFEKRLLKEVRNNELGKSNFQDDWIFEGFLQINFKTHPWEEGK